MTAVSDETGSDWPPIKKALWRVLMAENINDGHYIKAFNLLEKLYAAALSAAPVGEPDGRLPEREIFWLIERTGHSQWIKDHGFASCFELTNDVWHAHRYHTERDAHERWRYLTAGDRTQYKLTEHIFIHQAFTPCAPVAQEPVARVNNDRCKLDDDPAPVASVTQVCSCSETCAADGVSPVSKPHITPQYDALGRRMEPVAMPDAQKDVLARCYGRLWLVHTDIKSIHLARRELLSWLTKDEQAWGIEHAKIEALAWPSRTTPPAPAASVGAEEIARALLKRRMGGARPSEQNRWMDAVLNNKPQMVRAAQFRIASEALEDARLALSLLSRAEGESDRK